MVVVAVAMVTTMMEMMLKTKMQQSAHAASELVTPRPAPEILRTLGDPRLTEAGATSIRCCLFN